ncbi:zinc ABC transporter substrate-binding protein [Marinomonas epiphytica]
MNKLVVSLGLGVLSPLALAKPTIVTSIKPVSMVVAAIAGDKANIEQIVSSTASPHDFALRPSDLRKIHSADSVVWVGESLENFLEKPLLNANKMSSSIEWMTLDNVVLREFGDEHNHDHDEHDHGHDEHDHNHDEHDHGHDEHDHGHDEHDHDHDEHDHDHDEHDHDHDEHDHDHDEHDHDHDEHDHDHDEHDHDSHAGHGHEGHDHTGTDPHVWLLPHNAQVLAQAVAEKLIQLDEENRDYYEQNLSEFRLQLEAQEKTLKSKFSSVQDVPYIVFHNAYQYFEKHYGLNNAGEVSVSPERKPGAKTITALREKITEHQVQCVFSEPQFSPAIIDVLLDGTKVKGGQLDPLGTQVEVSKYAYIQFINGLADSYLSCLG